VHLKPNCRSVRVPTESEATSWHKGQLGSSEATSWRKGAASSGVTSWHETRSGSRTASSSCQRADELHRARLPAGTKHGLVPEQLRAVANAADELRAGRKHHPFHRRLQHGVDCGLRSATNIHLPLSTRLISVRSIFTRTVNCFRSQQPAKAAVLLSTQRSSFSTQRSSFPYTC
jgi:hypothetical protein